jgi:hypothetical protein
VTDLPPPGGFPPPPPGPAAPGPGWWQASDGNWYPPDQQPGWGAPQYVAAPEYGYGYAAQPVSGGTNGFAIASMVLGILWIWWIGSILAVIFGHVALGQIARQNQSGRGMAIAGLVLGYIGLLLLAAGVLMVIANPEDFE